MTKFDESIAKLAWLSPYTHSHLGWKETKMKTILQILPLIGTYYIFKEDKDGNIFIETILNELTDTQLPDNFFERIEKEEILLVVEKHQEAFKNSLMSERYEYLSKQLENNNQHVGKVIWKGFQKDLPKPILNEIVLSPINNNDVLVSFDILSLEYLTEWIKKLSKEDKLIFIKVFEKIVNELKVSHRLKQEIYSSNFWVCLDLSSKNYVTQFFIEFFKNLIECLKRE